jgi:hypothetical protein
MRGAFICQIVEAARGQNPQEVYTPIADKDILIESMNGEPYIIRVGGREYRVGTPMTGVGPPITFRPDAKTFIANLLKAAGATTSTGGGRQRKTRRRHK